MHSSAPVIFFWQLPLVIRYLFVGGFNATTGYLIFLAALQVLHLNPLLAYGITVLVWTPVGYKLQRLIVFRSRPSFGASLKYFGSQVVIWILGITGMFVGVEILSLRPEISYWLNFITWTTAMFLYSRLQIFRS